MFRGHQKLLTELLQESLIQLCSRFFPQNVDIEIDGLVCIGLNGSNEQVVLKIHKVLRPDVTSSACYHSSDGNSPVNLMTTTDLSRTYNSTEADTSLTTTVNIDSTLPLALNRSLKVWKCKQCQTVFRRFADYDYHVRQQHDKFACSLCDQCFTLFSNLKRHFKLHTGLKPFKCHRCHVAFSRKADLRIHWRRHSSDGNTIAQQHVLSQECSVGNNANAIQLENGGESSSFVAVKAETSISDYQNSEAVVKIEDNMFEVDADSNYPTPAQTHIFLPTSAFEGSTSVETSSSSLLAKSSVFEVAVKEDVDERTFECCSQTWQGFNSYENHVLNRHSRFPCHLCQQTFTSHNNRRRHVTCNHGSGKKFECNICEKHFTRPDIVKEHKLIHTKSYQLKKCSHCGFSSEKKTALLAHLKKCFGYKNIDADINSS